MAIPSLSELTDLHGKRCLIRVDFNVPLDKQGGIANDRRIRAALPTLRYVLDRGGKAIVMSHLGRPKGDPKKDALLRMDNVARRLSELLEKPVRKVDQVVGPAVVAAVNVLRPGEILVLENLRFHPGEEKNDAEMASQLAIFSDVYINDAFGTCHRAHTSVHALPQILRGQNKPCVAGLLLEKELRILGELLSRPKQPVVALLGGAKVSDKIEFIRALLSRVHRILIGGAMTYTFMKALGQSIGNSRCEEDKLDLARQLWQEAKERILLPLDHLVADRGDPAAQTRVVEGDIPEGWLGVDLGPKTLQRYAAELRSAATIVWNGPVGWFEIEPFGRGTRHLAEVLAQATQGGAVTIVGGGETAEAVEAFGLDSSMTHVSTGGGAFLEFIANEGRLPALEVLETP
ncbi:MAG: phosphoglycerate kinase [Gemmatales bacterium]|nr:phosphoglycerate kinase [Gemmatales bacterium]MCS7161660.1 phosphoglycerate kinase [Gemmatales bacterium]MDW8176863.1 phosphoglycerate kinase [Gemmatales bacterium]MDW8221322.1 phosphoglycerate kinase [Gemmatales bacterium]